ncbi:MAG: corrinoid protein [Chloroflexi bacterium]|nr:corrinoid protein [Chloroflexota bacterium]
MSEMYGQLSVAVLGGSLKEIKKLTQMALDGGASAQQVLDLGLLPGMDEVGKRFKVGAMFIPEVLLSAKTMTAAMELLKPLLAQTEGGGRGTVVIGTVQGDLHNIGKNLVAMMLEGAGFTVVDLGIDVKPQAFLDAVKQHKPKLLGMSALLTTTMPRMGETIHALEEAGVRGQVKVMVGGAPVTQEFVTKIRADAYAANAGTAVEVAKALVGG